VQATAANLAAPQLHDLPYTVRGAAGKFAGRLAGGRRFSGAIYSSNSHRADAETGNRAGS